MLIVGLSRQEEGGENSALVSLDSRKDGRERTEPLFRDRENPEEPFTLQKNFIIKILAKVITGWAFSVPIINEPFI